MEITQVRVFPVEEDKLKAFVSVVFDDCFVVSDIKIIEGTQGLFISMPSKKRKNGTFRDIAHPLNSETRRRIEESIIARYRQVISEEGGRAELRVREIGSAPEAQTGPRANGRSEAFGRVDNVDNEEEGTRGRFGAPSGDPEGPDRSLL